MKILADQNIPRVQDYFKALGDVKLFEGRSLKSEDLKGIDALLIRSVSKIKEPMLELFSPSFIGTATAGVDHIDADYVQSKSTYWTNAPGSNARSVAEYSLAAWISLGVIDQIDRLSIWGYGHVGKEVDDVFRAVKKEILAYDPLLSKEEFKILSDEEKLFDTDAVSLHMPLTDHSVFPTRKKINKEWLSQLKPKVHFLNAGRGEVINEADLLAHYISAQNRKNKMVLDVYNDEPNPNSEILKLADILTPHIAGYSFTGKVRGTKMLLDSLCKFKELEIPPLKIKDERVLISEKTLDWKSAVLEVYDPQKDSEALLENGAELAPGHFDSLRKNYPKRLEFSDCKVRPLKSEDADILSALGFHLE